MEWFLLYCLIPAVLGFGGGFLYGRRGRQDRERKKLLALEAEEKKKEEEAFEASILKAKRQALAESTRAALDFGYTMQQVLDWAYHEVYFADFQPASRKGRNVSTGGYYSKWEYTESQEAADNRQKQERYDYLKKVLLGQADSPALEDRNTLDAMLTAGVEANSQVFRRINQESLAEDLEEGGLSRSQIHKVATIIQQAAEEAPSEEEEPA